MSASHYGGTPNPKAKPRDFFALTGVKFPNAQKTLPFPVPDTTRDLLLGMYLTSELAVRYEDVDVKRLYYEVQAFCGLLNEALVATRKGSDTARAQVTAMLRWPECPELRYGYSLIGSDGLGLGGGKLAHDVMDILLDVPELAVVAVDHPDVLALLPNVSIDRMGDFVGSVAKNSLIALTQRFASEYFPRSTCLRDVDVRGVWDQKQMRYVTRPSVVLPVADDGRAILLPHKKTVRSSPPLHARQFARFISRYEMDKVEVLKYIRAYPGILRDFVDDVFKDEWRYRERRMFR